MSGNSMPPLIVDFNENTGVEIKTMGDKTTVTHHRNYCKDCRHAKYRYDNYSTAKCTLFREGTGEYKFAVHARTSKNFCRHFEPVVQEDSEVVEPDGMLGCVIVAVVLGVAALISWGLLA